MIDNEALDNSIIFIKYRFATKHGGKRRLLRSMVKQYNLEKHRVKENLVEVQDFLSCRDLSLVEIKII